MLSACAASTVTPDTNGRVRGTVVNVSDGDTITVKFANKSEKIRLIGVDTPETVHPTKPVGCFGPEASAHTKSLLPKGTDVYVVRDVEARDYYRRLLGYVYRVSDDLFINLDLVAQGFGTPLSIAPNTAFESQFVAAAQQAEQSNIGLWAQCRR